MRLRTSSFAFSMTSGRSMVRMQERASTWAAVRSPLWAKGLQDWATICQVCPTFPMQAVAILMFKVGAA